jgi:Ferric reductase NAD binding domain
LPPAKRNEGIEIISPRSQDSCSNPQSDKGSSKDKVPPNDIGSYKLVFYARPYTGWTRHLRDTCINQQGKTINSKILIEGPYGTSAPLHHYENVIFIMGGTGISCAISYLQDHIVKSAAHTTKTNNISLVFSAKQLAMIHDITARELGPALARSDVRATFNVTSPRESPAIVDENVTFILGRSTHDVEIRYGRPDIKAAILGFVGNEGSIAVMVCGPPSMADEARAVVHQVLKNGKIGVAYFEETFGW